MAVDADEQSALRALGGLVANGLVSALIAVAMVTFSLPLVMRTRCACGASLEARELRARCLALGVTPEQLRGREPR